MIEWLIRFSQEKEDLTLTLNGETFDKYDCMKFGEGSDEPPVVRYMFWDVVGDFMHGPSLPIIPTLDALKSSPKKRVKHA